tara:strand:+ start:217 stop:396 length:180 start_codon:yes stop_codon:yes gene_type:complete
MKRYSKYRIIKGFDTKSKAEQHLASLEGEAFSVLERKWQAKDKKRYYVRELVRKGRKIS